MYSEDTILGYSACFIFCVDGDVSHNYEMFLFFFFFFFF